MSCNSTMEFEFKFILPRKNSDLLNGDGSAYFVEQTYNINEIPNKLKDANQAFQSSDAFYLFDHFAVFFSVIENAQKMQINQLLRIIDVMYNTTKKYGEMITAYLNRNELNRQVQYMNLTKMVMYLMTSLVREVDKWVVNDNSTAAKKGKKQNESGPYQMWDERRFEALKQIFNIIQLPLEKLWSTSIAEESFVNLFCNLAYHMLSQPSIKEKRVVDAVFQIFGIAIKQYNHAMAFPIKIIQILENNDTAVTAIAHGLKILAEEYNITTVYDVLMKEFVERLNVASPDLTVSKNFSQFLTEVSEICPKMSVTAISNYSEDLLNLEPYVIRNSLLVLMGKIIIRNLSNENLDEEQKELRDEFLDDLLSHIEDVNSYVRSKALQIWNELKVEGAVPLAFHIKILRLAVERLEDRTATVRKNSVTLLKSFLETNPFSSKLSLQELEVQFEKESTELEAIADKIKNQEQLHLEAKENFDREYKEKLYPVLQKLLENEEYGKQNDEDIDTENAVQRVLKHIHDSEFQEVCELIITLDAFNYEKRIAMDIDQQIQYFLYLLTSYFYTDYKYEFDVKALQVGFLSDSVEFSKIITKAVPKIEMLLMSTTNSDVCEAIDFFTTGYLFNIKGTEKGMRRMLSLIWTGDKDKRNAVTNAYNKILFQTNATGRAHSIKVVDNLYNFFQIISAGEYGAFEFMMTEWIESNVIDANIVQVFFERFTLKLNDSSENLSRCCLQFLILASTAKPSIVTSNKGIITDIALSDRSSNDPRILAGCLELLMNAIQPGTPFYQRYEKDESLDTILNRFKQVFFYPKCPEFEKVSSCIIKYVYQMYQKPDIIMQQVVVDLCNKLTDISNKFNETHNSETDNPSQSQSTKTYIPDYLLARLIYIIGYIASREMMYLDIDIYNNMKYREDLTREKKNQQKKRTSHGNNNNSKRNTLNQSASDVLKRLSTAAEPQQEPDDVMVGATAEDSIAELINQICEDELICSSHGMLSKFVPLVIEILNQPGKYRNSYVQKASCVTLTRFMKVSSKFCAEYIPFLMNIMDKTKDVDIKCNIIVGLSDFTCRFPNVVEPWTSNLYLTLLEKNDVVRLTAVKMLSHLILQEMIRVRGQLSDMAVCIVDSNEEIRDVTKEFFKAIKDKSNILYNVLPDIISRLSSADGQLEEQKFRTIMQNIIGLIDKDRQVESLVEKLCLRFKITSVERQWRDIAYCLSLLRHTEKTLNKLIEHIPHFKDKIQNDDVMDCFKTIITNANKQTLKKEMKEVAKVLESKLQECLSTDNVNAENVENNKDTSTTPAKGHRKRGQKITARRRARHESSSSDESDFEERRAPPTRIGKKMQKTKIIETESDDDSGEQPARSRRKRK